MCKSDLTIGYQDYIQGTIAEEETFCSCGYSEYFAYGAIEITFRNKKKPIYTSFITNHKMSISDKIRYNYWKFLVRYTDYTIITEEIIDNGK